MQLELFGGPPLSRDIAFFAIMPPVEVAARLARFCDGFSRRHGLGGPRHPPERMHISLWGIRLAPQRSAALAASMAAVGSDVAWPSFEVALTRVQSFGRSGKRPLVLRCGDGASAALKGLHDRLFDVATRRGLYLKRRWDYTPHLTLGYDNAPAPDLPLAQPVLWTARELVLIRSEQGRGRHTPLGRWRLG